MAAKSVRVFSQHGKGYGSSEISLPAPVARSRLSADEGIVSQRPLSRTESTMELMTNVSRADSRRSSNSIASTVLDGASTFSVVKSTQREVYTLPIELATQRTDDTVLSWTTTKETARLHSVESPRLQVSDQDIEMTHMTFPRAGMGSTDNLVPSKKLQIMDTISSWGNSSASASVDGAKSEPPTSTRQLPDYKPIPLRWPFQVLLVMIVAGTFAFFEYQIHNLPPARYKMFHVNPPEMRSAAIPGPVQGDASALNDHADPYIRASPASRILDVAPVTAWAKTTGSPGQLFEGAVRIAAPVPDPTPDPTPAPRPPESLYPGPIKLTSTYCGWAPPVWVLFTRLLYSDYSGGTGLGSPQTSVIVEQTFPTFWTKNESWCPCVVDMEKPDRRWWDEAQWSGWPWTSGWATRLGGPEFWVSTHDKECRSVLSALSYFNLERWHKTVPPESLIIPLNIQELTAELTVSEHPVSQMPWPWPITDSEGQISLPLLAQPRTDLPKQYQEASLEDELGNTDLPYFFMNAWASTAEGYSLMWWTLPFARALQTQTTTTTTAPESTRTRDIISPESLLPSSEKISTLETTIEATEIHSQSLSSPALATSITEGASTVREGASTSSNADQRTGSIQSGESGTEEVKLSTTLGWSSTDISLSTSVRVDMTSGGHVGKEPSTAELTSISTTTSVVISTVTSVLASSESGINFSIPPVLPSSDTTTTFITSPSPNTKPDQTASLQSLGGNSTPITSATHSTPYSLRLHQGPKPASSSSNNNGISSHPANNTIYPNPSPETTTRFHGAHPTCASDEEPSQPPTTPAGPVPPGSAARFMNLHTEADFLMASLIPVLLATLLAIAVQVLTGSVSAMLPFRGLGHGARLRDSLMLPRNIGLLTGPSVSIRFLRRYHDTLPLLNGLLTLLSIVLVPISSEAIKIELSTNCRSTKRPPRPGLDDSPLMICAFGLRKSGATMRLSEGILVAIAISILALGYLLLRWRTGVATEPWSIASMAALMSDSELRDMIQSIENRAPNGSLRVQDKEVRNIIGEGRQFRIGYYEQSLSGRKSYINQAYGIYAIPTTGCDSSFMLTTRDPPEQQATSPGHKIRWWKTVKQSTKDTIIRGSAALLTAGLLVLILNYELSIGPVTQFEEFMNSQSFGVRILFTAFGTATGWFWDEYFSQMSSNTIYQGLASDAQPARTSILLSSEPADPFTAIYRSVTPALDIPLLAIAVARLLAKLTPILFSGIPFRNTITFRMHEACTWMAIGILLLMLCVLLQGLLDPIVRKCRGRTKKQDIDMPVKTETIAGCMYYLAGSTMLTDFEGLSTMRTRERDRIICEMGRRYAFRRVSSDNGPNSNSTGQGVNTRREVSRMRVDYAEAFEESSGDHQAR